MILYSSHKERLKDEARKKTIMLYSQILEYQIRVFRRYITDESRWGPIPGYFRDLAVLDNWTGMLALMKTTEKEIRRDLEVINSSKLIEVEEFVKKELP